MYTVKALRHLTRSRIFRRYFISYLVILLVPLLVIPTAMYRGNNTIVSAYIFDAQMSSVKQIRRAMDSEARRLLTVSTMLSNDEDVLTLMNVAQEDMMPNHALAMSRLRALMTTSLMSTKESTRSALLYFRKSEYAIDSAHALPLQQIYRDETEEQIAQRQSVLNGKYSAEWIRSDTNRTANDVYFITSIVTGIHSEPATFLIEMQSTFLNGILKSAIASENEWTVMYDDGIVYQSDASLPDFRWEQMTEAEGQLMADGYMISYVRSEVTGTVYANIIAADKLMKPLHWMRSLMYTLLTICMLACGILSYFMALRNFNPLQKLVQMSNDSTGSHGEEDEYEVLHRKLLEAADEKRLLLDRATMDERMKSSYDAYTALREMPSWEHFPLQDAGTVCLAQIGLIDYTDNCSPAQTMLMMRDVFDFPQDAQWKSVVYQRSSELMMLIKPESNNVSAFHAITEKLYSAVQCVRDVFAADCVVGISALHETKDEPRKLLRIMEIEARTALNTFDQADSIRVYRMNNQYEMAFRSFVAEANAGKNMEDALSAFAEAVKHIAPQTEHPDGTEYDIKQRVIEIVRLRYADPTLNVSQIAAQLGRSADYVSKVFKQTTLIGMLDYIHHTRVSAAKHMLVEKRNMSVAEISEAVGYVSIDSFIRAFKRIMGTTPGKYRENAIITENDDE